MKKDSRAIVFLFALLDVSTVLIGLSKVLNRVVHGLLKYWLDLVRRLPSVEEGAKEKVEFVEDIVFIGAQLVYA